MIGALTSSSPTKIIFEDCPRGLSRCGTEIFCLAPRKTSNVNFMRFHSAQTRILKPLHSSFSSKVSQVEEQKTWWMNKPKECAFGEHFFILGDDPVFGLWDPENAIPLNWSDGHVWTVDLDLPVGKSIEFKFILKGKTGIILWQPGQNRVFETLETSNTITICEDWENADLQSIFEEELVPVNREGQESSAGNLDMPVVAENVPSAQSKEKVELTTDNIIEEKEAEVLGNGIEENPAEIVAENIGYIKDDSDAGFSSSDAQNERKMDDANESMMIADESETEVVMVTEEECPVLVPGLTPVPSFEKEEDVTSGGDEEANDASGGEVVVNKVETDISTEIIETRRQTKGEEREEEGKGGVVEIKSHREAKEEEEEEMRHDVMEKDILWGRRTLQKLLNSFRLL
ncbi:PREDICTED: uncharacterized protein LOC104816652 [Tarenaya hassleriana]|uniref:uncharacterized protein LOC104816652 n=1 Tax=Tarenaya hassleriana TaxID=28532 RepID=UPI00053CA9E0|nr:PREDICTED: uncharacterized protein LOC104816652 [Tarenaya hassleriana]